MKETIKIFDEVTNESATGRVDSGFLSNMANMTIEDYNDFNPFLIKYISFMNNKTFEEYLDWKNLGYSKILDCNIFVK